ncbi:protein Atg16l2 [Clinocottus analis]|uniref:protein Atg16l2 n=1 Tax=Clinocottus analis TaxID=304258 RepID=UPI0035C07D9B
MTEAWKRHVVAALKRRDREQHARFQDLVCFYSRLLDRTGLTDGILSCSVRHPDSSCSSLKKTTGDMALQVLELQQQIKTKECVLEDQQSRLMEAGRQLAGALDAGRALRRQVELVQEQNAALKLKYDERLRLLRREEAELRGEELRGQRLLRDLIQHKQQAAAHMNHRNQRRSRAQKAELQKELQTAARSKVTVDSAPASRSTSPKPEDQQESGGQTRLFRSLSASTPRVLSSFRELFQRRRGHSSCSLEEDLMFPVRVSLSARVPVRALQVLEAHEQGINAVRFSSSSPLLATGGTDRVVKLWDVQAGE